MYADDIIAHAARVNETRRPKLVLTKDEDERDLIQSTIRLTENIKTSLTLAQRYFLDVRQAEAFTHARLSFDVFPPLVSHLLYIEFNGRLRFNYSIPYVEDGVGRLDETPTFKFNDLKQATEYRSVLITYCPKGSSNLADHSNAFPEEDVIRAFWFEPIYHVKGGDVLDDFVLTFSRSSWPDTVSRGVYLDEVQKKHARRLMFMTANLMSFLAAENLTFVKIRPEHHERYKLKGLPRSTQPYHVLPFQVPHYKYLHPQHDTGAHQGHRYDVRGHFRHLRDDRYARNEDGSTRVIWISEHQRGLAHDVYVPALHRGVIGAEIIDCDQFIRNLASKPQHQLVGGVAR